MNNTLKVIFGVVVALVIGGFVGYFLHPAGGGLGTASITPYNCLNNQILCNELQSIANPLTGWNATSATMGALTVGSTTVQSSTIAVTSTPGDYLEWGESTSTANVNLNCTVSAANTVVCTKTTAVPGSAGISAVTSTVYVLDLPKATFVSPTGL